MLKASTSTLSSIKKAKINNNKRKMFRNKMHDLSVNLRHWKS